MVVSSDYKRFFEAKKMLDRINKYKSAFNKFTAGIVTGNDDTPTDERLFEYGKPKTWDDAEHYTIEMAQAAESDLEKELTRTIYKLHYLLEKTEEKAQRDLLES